MKSGMAAASGGRERLVEADVECAGRGVLVPPADQRYLGPARDIGVLAFAAGLPVRAVGPQLEIGVRPRAPVMIRAAPRIGGRNGAEPGERGKTLRSRGIHRVGRAVLLQQRDHAL